MAVEVHVEGRIAVGRLADFFDGVRQYSAYAAAHGYAQPRVLHGLSGPMNSVRLVYTYPDLAAYEADEARTAEDRDYARAALAMPFVDGSVRYTIYRTA
ncbi:MAG TPA: NIPSNAP family protein [Thermomicrobiales bacterium]|nr:NIPSNAP family protein [Thermomicrobiales bacterium]